MFGLSTINAFLENGAPHSYILVASSGTLGHSLGYSLGYSLGSVLCTPALF